jgi:maltose/moltooligosaccharide transporter
VLLWLTTRFSPKAIHTVCLACGGLGLVSVMFIRTPEVLLISMVGVGIAWASILSMPYAMLAGSLPPERTGVYMGIFNFFIVIPQIVAALGFGWVMSSLLGNNRLYGVVAGGVAMLIAALLTMRVRIIPPVADELQRVAEEQGMLPTATPPETPL